MDFHKDPRYALVGQPGRPPPNEPAAPALPAVAAVAGNPLAALTAPFAGFPTAWLNSSFFSSSRAMQSSRPPPSNDKSKSRASTAALGADERPLRQEKLDKFLTDNTTSASIEKTLSTMRADADKSKEVHQGWLEADKLLMGQSGADDEPPGGQQLQPQQAPIDGRGLSAGRAVVLVDLESDAEEDLQGGGVQSVAVASGGPRLSPGLPVSQESAAASLPRLREGPMMFGLQQESAEGTTGQAFEEDGGGKMSVGGNKRAHATATHEAESEAERKRARMAEAAERRRKGIVDLAVDEEDQEVSVGRASVPPPAQEEEDDDIIEVVETKSGRSSSRYGLRQGRRQNFSYLLHDDVEGEVIIMSEEEGRGGSSSDGKRRASQGQEEEQQQQHDYYDEDGGKDVMMNSCWSYLLEDVINPSVHYQFSPGALSDMISRLLNDEVLNDEVLNRAVNLLTKDERSEKLLLFNTFWYEKIKDDKVAEARQWLQKAMGDRRVQDIHYVCVPVNISNAHWILVVVDLTRSTAVVWDPAGSEHQYIVHKIKDTLRTCLDIKSLRQMAPPRTLPQQSDHINCGLFVTLYLIHLVFKDGDQPCTFSVKATDLYRRRLQLLAWILSSQHICPETDLMMQQFAMGKVEKLMGKWPIKKIVLGVWDDGGHKRFLLDAVMYLLNLQRQDVLFLESKWYKAIVSGDADEAVQLLAGSKDIAALSCICAVIYADDRPSTKPLLARINMATDPYTIDLHGGETLFDSDAVPGTIEAFFQNTLQSQPCLKRRFPVELINEDSRQSDLALVVHAMYTCAEGLQGQLPPLDFTEDGMFRYKLAILRWMLRSMLK